MLVSSLTTLNDERRPRRPAPRRCWPPAPGSAANLPAPGSRRSTPAFACGTDRGQRHAASVLAAGNRQGAGRDLQQHVDLLPRRRGIGHHDLAAVDHVDQEFFGDELVDLLAVHFAITVSLAEEVLADQDRRFLGHFGRRLDLFVIDDRRAAGREGQLRALVELGLVLGGVERQDRARPGPAPFPGNRAWLRPG